MAVPTPGKLETKGRFTPVSVLYGRGPAMRIHDYEAGKVLKDVEIALTREEIEDLAAYLARMLTSPEVKSVQLIDVSHGVVDSELSVSFVA